MLQIMLQRKVSRSSIRPSHRWTDRGSRIEDRGSRTATDRGCHHRIIHRINCNVSTNAHAFRTGIHHLLISESGRHRARHTGSQPYTATSSCCFNTHRWLSLCVISVSFLSVLPLFFGGRFWCSEIGFALLLFPLLSIRFIHHGRHILRWIWHSLRWMQNRLLLLIRKLIRLQRDRLRKSRPLTHWMRILRKRRPQHLRLRLLRSDL